MSAPVVWTPAPAAPASGSAPSPEGLIATLRELPVDGVLYVPGWNADKVGNHIRAARRGTSKWFEARTVPNGARIRRCE